MPATKYSLKTDAGKQLSENFKVREFASKCGGDSVLIDSRLVDVLQKIRDHFGVPVVIASGYRSPAHNKKVGGATNSRHMAGDAADIKIKGVKVLELAQLCEGILRHFGIPGGIGIYGTQQGDTGASGNWVHVDVRASRSRWEKTDRTGNKQVSVSGWTPTAYPKGGTAEPAPPQTLPVLRNGSSGTHVAELQGRLNVLTGANLTEDGKFGPLTEKAVRGFQSARKIAADGIVGEVTWAELLR